MDDDFTVNRRKLEAVNNRIAEIEAELRKLPLFQEWHMMIDQRDKIRMELINSAGFNETFSRHWSDDPALEDDND